MPWTRKGQEIDIDEFFKTTFGGTPEEVKAKLDKIDSVETTVTAIKTAAEEQKNGINEIKTIVSAYATKEPPKNNNGGGDASGGGDTKVETIDWSEDADGAFNQRVTPLVVGTLETRALISKRMAIDEINKKHPDVPFDLLADDINAIADKSRLADRAQEQFWKNIYYKVKGEKQDEILRDRAQRSGKFFVETGSSVRVETDIKKEPVLSDEQKKIAKGLGISEKVYAENAVNMGLI